MDSFDPREPDSRAMRTIERQAIYWIVIAVTVFISGYLFQSILLIFAEKVALKTKVRYLESVLRQDEEWFDENDPEEMSN